jgi:hypothetical protein
MISATFSLFQQVINMKSFPPLRMICTSDKFQGQVYIPAVNWVLMIITIAVVGAFSNLQNLTNAYGFSVSTVMLSTSILLGISMFYVKHIHWIFAVSFVLIFGFFDGEPDSPSSTVPSHSPCRPVLGCSSKESASRCMGTFDDWNNIVSPLCDSTNLQLTVPQNPFDAPLDLGKGSLDHF